MKSNLPDGLSGAGAVPADVTLELARVAGRRASFGDRLHWFEQTTSTNDIASRLADLGAEEGTTVVAESQTAGRGRLGRSWFSPPGAGLYVSMILKPSREFLEQASPGALITLASGVALAEAVQASTGLVTDIKWPNDLLVGRRKVAGILAEAAAQGGQIQFIVLGFGLNLRAAAYPPELADRATSIEAELGRPSDRAVILAEALAAHASRYDDLRHGRFDAILSAWRRLAPSLRGATVEWNSPAGLTRGRAEDIDETGALLVRVGSRMERLVAGEVRWV